MTEINWRRYAEVAYVSFGWSPETFWRATPMDFWCTYHGFRKLRGGGQANPLSRAELDDLLKSTLRRDKELLDWGYEKKSSR
ncbi:phage tail assembly chaperone [Paremcibacter congregatus]|uniref:phage tail assembly chaperone n=1 Tax=Paremcibacter congregatus TaxID=2043170 RepID=UPI003A9422D5